MDFEFEQRKALTNLREAGLDVDTTPNSSVSPPKPIEGDISQSDREKYVNAELLLSQVFGLSSDNEV